MNKIIHRILKFQKVGRKSFDQEQFKPGEVNDYILLSCIDKRIIPNEFTKIPIGHLFVVRNAGNFVPISDHHNIDEISSEGGAIELAVKNAGIKDIIISGHSDCKAMAYLSQINQSGSEESKATGPLSKWIRKYGQESWNKYQKYLHDRSKPLTFQLKPPPSPLINAFIDKDLPLLDCLSQINCLQQSENVATFPFLRKELLDNSVKIHTLWKELSMKLEDPILFLFDGEEEKFLKISDEYSDKLIKDEND